MKVAQQLYEGIETEKGQIAFITYMRTDSTRISSQAREKAVEIIKNNFGERYIGPIKASKGGKKIQDAHEAIRPTYPEIDMEAAKKLISGDFLKLYALIWNRFLASQMAGAEYEVTEVTVIDKSDRFAFTLVGEKRVFDGFERVLTRSSKDELNHEYGQGQEIKPDDFIWEKELPSLPQDSPRLH
jgi:Topoisomerase IA